MHLRPITLLVACVITLLGSGCQTASNSKTATAQNPSVAAVAPDQPESSSQELFAGEFGESIAASHSSMFFTTSEKPLITADTDRRSYDAWKQTKKS